MKTKIQLIDKISNQVIFEGDALIESDLSKEKLVFQDEERTYVWKVFEKGLIIETISEAYVHLTLRQDHSTKGHIHTDFGQIDLQCRTTLYKIDKNYVEVVYELLQGKDSQNFHFILYKMNEEELHEIH